MVKKRKSKKIVNKERKKEFYKRCSSVNLKDYFKFVYKCKCGRKYGCDGKQNEIICPICAMDKFKDVRRSKKDKDERDRNY